MSHGLDAENDHQDTKLAYGPLVSAPVEAVSSSSAIIKTERHLHLLLNEQDLIKMHLQMRLFFLTYMLIWIF